MASFSEFLNTHLWLVVIVSVVVVGIALCIANMFLRKSQRDYTRMSGLHEACDEDEENERIEFYNNHFKSEAFEDENRGCFRGFNWKNHPILSFPGIIRDFDLLIFSNLVLVIFATWLCDYYELHVNATSAVSLMVIPFVFPLSFSISEAHRLRQDVLEHVANMQAHFWTLYAMHRDYWKMIQNAKMQKDRRKKSSARNSGDGNSLKEPSRGSVYRSSISNAKIKTSRLGRAKAKECFITIAFLCRHIRDYSTQERQNRRNCALETVYDGFRKLRDMNETLIQEGARSGVNVPATQLYQTISFVVTGFEQFRIGRDYPTPRSIRQFYKVVGLLLPILLAPVYCAGAAEQEQKWGQYYVAAAVTLLFGQLLSVADQLDNPFNEVESRKGLVALRAHPDNIDLSRLEFHPFLAITGKVDIDGRRQSRAEATAFGIPTRATQARLDELFNQGGEELMRQLHENASPSPDVLDSEGYSCSDRPSDHEYSPPMKKKQVRFRSSGSINDDATSASGGDGNESDESVLLKFPTIT